MALLVRLRYTCRPTDRASKFLAVIVYSLALFCSCDGSLTVKPSNIEAVVGQRVQLKCSTSESYYVLWDHASVGSTSRSYIFFSGVLVLPYSQRFQLDWVNATGAYNLVIPSVQKEDAGNYRCMDMVGHGEQAEAELIVLDSNPQCETDVFQFCDRTSQDFETSCTVGFRGNLVPKMECSSNGVTTFSSVVKGQIGDSVTYNLRLTAHWPLDDHPVVCRTSLSHVSSFVNPTVMYAFGSNQTLTIDHRKTVDCRANSSEQCSYQWIHKDKNVVISNSQTLRTDEAGQYRCEATCMLRDQMCIVIPFEANLAIQEDTDTNTIVLAVGVSLGIGLTVACVLMMVYCLKMKKSRRKGSGDCESATTPCLGMNSAPSSTVSSQETSSVNIPAANSDEFGDVS